MAKRGISILDLLAPVPGSQAVIPADLAGRLENLAVTAHRTQTSPGAVIHTGMVQPLSDLGFPALRTWPVEVPGFNRGLPFRLTRVRATTAADQNLEPAGASSFLDLVLDRVAITIPGLRPATLVPTGPATPAHLLPDPTRSSVKIVGAGVLRISLNGQGDIVSFVTEADPFDPAAPQGSLGTVAFEPASFLFGDSPIGMTVDTLTWDASTTISPPEVIARGQTPAWQGISIAEATLFLPPNAPLVESLNVGVKDVLLGSPMGLQGEVHVQLGRTPISAAAVEFLQDVNGAPQTLTVGGSGHEFTVPLLANTPATAPVRARITPTMLGMPTQPHVDFTLPDQSGAHDDTGWFTASVGQHLGGTFSELVDGQRVNDVPDRWTITQAEAQVKHAPRIDAAVNGHTYENVTWVAGTASAIEAIAFRSGTAADTITWRYGIGPAAVTGKGETFAIEQATGQAATLQTTDSRGHHRRASVLTWPSGSLTIGCAAGVFDGPSQTPIKVSGVRTTYDLNDSHNIRFTPVTDAARLATVSGGTVSVPDGSLAEVALEVGLGTEPDVPAPPPEPEDIRHLEVRFDLNEDAVVRWGGDRPRAAGATPSRQAVSDWAAYFPGAQFVVIGRTCDRGDDASQLTLGAKRAASVAAWLPSTADVRAELAPMTPAAVTLYPLTSQPHPPSVPGRLIHSEVTAPSEAQRQLYRRADVYAIGGTYTPPGGQSADGARAPVQDAATSADRGTALVPGADLEQVTLPGIQSPRVAYLVSLSVTWDSPTVMTWADAIPTKAEFTVAWGTQNVTMPKAGGGDETIAARSPSQPPAAPTTEVLTVKGTWVHDTRTGETVLTLGVSSTGDPKGLVAFDNTVLAASLAIAPALLAGIDAAGIDGAAVRLGAIALAGTVLSLAGKEGEVVINAVELEHRQKALGDFGTSRTRASVDYTASLGFDITAAGLGGLRTDDGHPLRVRYKKVGLEFDAGKANWYDRFGLVYEDVSFEVGDPGRWQISGPLGQLLQVTATRAGVGSTWFELDLEFALDLGVVSVTGATVRAVFGDDGFTAQLRGLGVAVDIPGVLQGEGRLVLGDGGAFTAAVELELVSLKAKAMGALAFDPAHDFLSIGLGLILPVGIPLGASGLGIFGFLGQFVANGRRALPSGMDDNPIEREFQWYCKPVEHKYEPYRGQWAVGLGMIVGTLPDKAFSFNATGMLVVAFPTPEVVFGIDANLVQAPQVSPTEEGTASGSLKLLGLIVVNPDAVMLGVRGRYTIPKVLDLSVPIDGYFPIRPSTGPSPKDFYLRIGSDGVASEGRPGDPVRIMLLPGTLDMQAFSYLMVEEKKLHKLGGRPEFSFDGFSLGMGAGFEITWSAGPIKLRASALLLVGLGTDPFLLKGGIFVEGELDLVIVSVAASGSLVATIWDDSGDVRVNLRGEFCGRVKFFFFTVKGCVKKSFGDPLTPSAPKPPAPIGKVSLTDRRGFTTALATSAPAGSEQTVWPDTVPVIEFTHPLTVTLPAGSAFTPPAPPTGPLWSGSSELKYAYRITKVELANDAGPLPGPLASNWWWPTHRPGVLATGDVAVSAEEGRYLALLSWDPASWSYWLTEGGAGTDGDPATTAGRVCDPPPMPERNCVLGETGLRTGPDTLTMSTVDPGTAPFPSRFIAHGSEWSSGRPLGELAVAASAAGLAIVPGEVFTHPLTGQPVWRLAAFSRFGFTATTTMLRLHLEPAMAEPELTLIVCTDQRPKPLGGGRLECRSVAETYPDETDLDTKAALRDLVFFSDDGLVVRAHPDTNGTKVMGISSRGRELDIVLDAPTSEVRIEIWTGDGATAYGIDEQGVALDKIIVAPGWSSVSITSITGASIASVHVSGPATYVAVTRVCVGVSDDAKAEDLPRVTGSGANGLSDWVPEVREKKKTRQGVCQIVAYRPQDPAPVDVVTVHEWHGPNSDAGTVSLVSLCGVSATAQAQAQGNADFLLGLLGQISANALAGPVGPVSAAAAVQPPPRPLLSANTGYTITVEWQWQGWIKTDGQPAPPALGATGWQPGGTESYHFRTAATLAPAGLPPAELTAEDTFDPRSLLRYVIAMEPETDAAPHFTDDTLLVHLAVDHAGQLAAQYGQDLKLRLRRTDPPPGSLAGQDHPPTVPFELVWRPLVDDLRPVGQRRILQAWRESACVNEPALGGTTGEVSADLEANAWYDLDLVCTPKATPTAEGILVTRTHFHTSRFPNTPALLAALGFETPASPFLAPDAFVSGPLPGGPLVVGDTDLDAALTAVGLDPWPIAPDPRTSILWLRDGTDWRLAGVLLEAPEAIVRTGRRGLEVAAASYAGIPLTLVRRNAAGTRVLLAAATPTVVTTGGELTVTLNRTVTDRTGAVTSTPFTGSRTALTVPRTVYVEQD